MHSIPQDHTGARAGESGSLLAVQRGPRHRRMEAPSTSGDRDLAWICESGFRSVGLQGINRQGLDDLNF